MLSYIGAGAVGIAQNVENMSVPGCCTDRSICPARKLPETIVSIFPLQQSNSVYWSLWCRGLYINEHLSNNFHISGSTPEQVNNNKAAPF